MEQNASCGVKCEMVRDIFPCITQQASSEINNVITAYPEGSCQI